MSKPRDTYKYEFKIGNRVVHSGITNDLERREGEHQRRRGWSGGHIKQVGRRTTRDGARRWEDEQREKGKPTGP
jgi:predicted GIY-YIG superfamily endonuclease